MTEDKQLEILLQLSNQLERLHGKHDALSEKITKLDVTNEHYKTQLDLALKLQSKYGEQISDLQEKVKKLEEAMQSAGINFLVKHPKITVLIFSILIFFAAGIVNFTINNYDAKQHPVLGAIDKVVDKTTGVDQYYESGMK